MASTIQLRVDDELKTKSDKLFRELGTDTTTANPYVSLSEDEFLGKLELSRKHAKAGKVRNADEVVEDMRNKYGL